MTVSIRLSHDEEARLRHLAKVTRRTLTSYIQELLDEHLDDLEDFYLAEQELRALRQGKVQTESLDKVSRDLGLDN